MKLAKIRFLERGESPLLPSWTKFLPAGRQAAYTKTYRPFRLEESPEGILTGILQISSEAAVSAAWRQNARSLLQALAAEKVSIVIPPATGEFPREVLPFAEGNRLANLFAFDGAIEALRRQGKEAAECFYLLCGGNQGSWRAALSALNNTVNHLAIFTGEPWAAEEIGRELYAERGLAVEIFSSPKNPTLQMADAVLACGMEQIAYEHLLKRGCVWLDLAGNRPVLRKLMQQRPDVAAAEGFFFHVGERQLEGRFAEAEAFLCCAAFRESWQFPLEEVEREELLAELRKAGFSVSGFSAFGKRVKIRKFPLYS